MEVKFLRATAPVSLDPGHPEFFPEISTFLVTFGSPFFGLKILRVKAPILFVMMKIVLLSIFSFSNTMYGSLTLGNF